MPTNAAPAPVWLRRLQAPQRIQTLEPIAARFVYALRLIAVHELAKRDPAAELAVRLDSMTSALHAMDLAKTVSRVWPEDVHVGRFCCQRLTHDEATIAQMITAASERNRSGFEAQLEGLVREARIGQLWDACMQLVGAELAHAAAAQD